MVNYLVSLSSLFIVLCILGLSLWLFDVVVGFFGGFVVGNVVVDIVVVLVVVCLLLFFVVIIVLFFCCVGSVTVVILFGCCDCYILFFCDCFMVVPSLVCCFGLSLFVCVYKLR